jgi:hypothetical protein
MKIACVMLLLCIVVIVTQYINIVDVQQTHKVVAQLPCEIATRQTHVTNV